MKTSTKRILSIGLAVFLFIGILVVYSSFIRPEVSALTEKRALVVSKENLFQNQENAVAQVRELIGQFESLATLQGTVSLALPPEENVTGILNQIQSIANLSNVSLGSFSIKPLAFEATKQPLVRRLGTLELSLIARGSYTNLKQFLNSLETNVRIVNVESFRVVPAGDPAADDYNFNLTVVTFYQE
ncbi:MAG: type 4a pilus biogenesis protein PilO [Candidatus Brennerbacteria bacterium]|nr:type 4a pilus biogenesis protein PilO [Candidatus Brennerbacteria bacterium]